METLGITHCLGANNALSDDLVPVVPERLSANHKAVSHWEDEHTNDKDTDRLPTFGFLSNVVCLMAVIRYICCLIWPICYSQVSMMVTDVLRQGICNSHNNVDRFTPTLTGGFASHKASNAAIIFMP